MVLFAPRGWALCDGSLLETNQYPELFFLISNKFGGNGVNTFALPDLRGRTIIHSGKGPDLKSRPLGAVFGTETHVLNSEQMATHTHVR
jgi:microcystin-dependent protein